MSAKYKNTYRIKSTRLQTWDYRWKAAYFITICTQNKAHYFGDIINGKMQLSNLGVIADVLIHEIKSHHDNIELGGCVVMPNHIHLILNITKEPSEKSAMTHTKNINQQMSSISPKSGSISTIIRSYKAAVTKHANRLGYEFKWQPRFHDHIIRDEAALNKLTEYVQNNPLTWEVDKFYKTTNTFN